MKLLFSVTAYIQGDPHFSEEKDDGSATVTDEGSVIPVLGIVLVTTAMFRMT